MSRHEACDALFCDYYQSAFFPILLCGSAQDAGNRIGYGPHTMFSKVTWVWQREPGRAGPGSVKCKVTCREVINVSVFSRPRCSLESLPVGCFGRVLKIMGEGINARRLMDLGLIPGTIVESIRR